MGVRLTVFFLCVVLIATFVDTIPDPPAINPPRIEHNVAPRIAIDSSATAALQSYWLLYALLFLLTCFSVLWTIELKSTFCSVALVVRHATDVSPPHSL
jgi:hypothetical protein